ncbi:hypothetical protein [Lewinella sp. W8]|uniref:hypothetical protein n=1 Tax=Lewinella sp. W8 TaxID=2528208 RepID=UPI00106864C4|nr:hypothetical protein [Lewinella sp. W8]MTB49348.1 hypothetical protein [Lewinella sp. W8]
MAAPKKKPHTERFIQDAVADQLNKRYYRRKPAYVSTEVYTRLKRADVMISFMRARKRPYVVVVEAKSRTTIHQLKLQEKDSRVRFIAQLTTLGLIVGLSAILGYQWYFNALNTLLLIGVFVVGSLLIGTVIRWLELSIASSISAIEQLSRYPANEHWIAVGENTFVRPAEYQALKKQCRKNGVGLIVVNQRGKIQLRVIPKPRHTFNDYLGKYGKRKDILATIDRNPDYGPTPPERAKKRRQLLNATLLLSVVGLLSTIAYEENYGPVVPDPFEPGWEVEAEVVAPATEAPISQPEPVGCTDFLVSERSFVVVDALLREDKARARIAELAAAGLTGQRMVPTECLNSWPAPGRFAVVTSILFPHRPEAKAAAERYRAWCEQKGLPAAYGRAVKVRPGK